MYAVMWPIFSLVSLIRVQKINLYYVLWLLAPPSPTLISLGTLGTLRARSNKQAYFFGPRFRPIVQWRHAFPCKLFILSCSVVANLVVAKYFYISSTDTEATADYDEMTILSQKVSNTSFNCHWWCSYVLYRWICYGEDQSPCKLASSKNITLDSVSILAGPVVLGIYLAGWLSVISPLWYHQLQHSKVQTGNAGAWCFKKRRQTHLETSIRVKTNFKGLVLVLIEAKSRPIDFGLENLCFYCSIVILRPVTTLLTAYKQINCLAM